MSRRDPRQPDRRPEVRPTSGLKTSATCHRSEAMASSQSARSTRLGCRSRSEVNQQDDPGVSRGRRRPRASGARRGPWCRAAGATRGRMGTRCPLPACARPACRSPSLGSSQGLDSRDISWAASQLASARVGALDGTPIARPRSHPRPLPHSARDTGVSASPGGLNGRRARAQGEAPASQQGSGLGAPVRPSARC